ncbi:MAG: HEPN domain-containing protein [Candidatus Kapabacteria bacterium]|nr:HEPN domain-containing protein [Candidatus Kapabacteria bacterium]
MQNEEKIIYWVELSNYDLDTAEAMLVSKRFLYVGFMCQQAVEKILKALYVKTKLDVPPKTHNLNALIQKIGIENEVSKEHFQIIDKLDPLNIEARYPTYKEELFKILTYDYCIAIIKETKELIEWIKMKL